jgi:hypothetical protein
MTSSRTSSNGLTTNKGWDLFIWGGLSTACGEVATLPIDVVKVRMQVNAMKAHPNNIGSHKMTRMFLNILDKEGIRALYSGLSPAVVRQLFHGGIRIGLYEPIKVMLSGKNAANHEKVPFVIKLLSGVISGILG